MQHLSFIGIEFSSQLDFCKSIHMNNATLLSTFRFLRFVSFLLRVKRLKQQSSSNSCELPIAQSADGNKQNIHSVSLTSHKHILHNIQYTRATSAKVIRAHYREKDVKICLHLFYNRLSFINKPRFRYGEEKKFLVTYQLVAVDCQ